MSTNDAGAGPRPRVWISTTSTNMKRAMSVTNVAAE